MFPINGEGGVICGSYLQLAWKASVELGRVEHRGWQQRDGRLQRDAQRVTGRSEHIKASGHHQCCADKLLSSTHISVQSLRLEDRFRNKLLFSKRSVMFGFESGKLDWTIPQNSHGNYITVGFFK